MASALDLALQLVDEGARDPVKAVKNAERASALLRRVRAEGSGPGGAGPRPELAQVFTRMEQLLARIDHRMEGGTGALLLAQIGCSHIVRVDDTRPLTQAAPESGPHKVEWPGGLGDVRSIFAGTTDGDPQSLSRVAVRISVNGAEEFFTTGTAPAFVPLLAFQPGNHNWFRLRDYPVTSTQRWTVSFRYEGAASGPQSVTPFLLFGYARRD